MIKSFGAEKALEYYAQAIAPSMEANLRLAGIRSTGDRDDLLGDLQDRLFREWKKKQRVTPGHIWMSANRKCRDLIAEYFRKRHPETPVSQTSDEEADAWGRFSDEKAARRAAIEEEMEAYRHAKAVLLEEKHPCYKDKRELCLYDQRLVELWEEKPEASVRELGRLLKQEFQRSNPLGNKDETFACKRLAEFLERLRKQLNDG